MTRRLDWLSVHVGEQLQLCEKCMGRRAGEPLVRLAQVEVVSVRREPLKHLVDDPAYGAAEAVREGFPEMSGEEFAAFFLRTHPKDKAKKRTSLETVVTRIEWRYL